MAQDDIDSEDLEELEVEDTDDDEELEEEPEDLDDDEEYEEESDADSDGEDGDEDEDEESDEETSRRRKSKDDDADDDDDEMLSPDDVEADLDMILKDRMVAAEEEGEEDEEETAPAVDEKAEAIDGIQPKRADEQLCSSCFLLVRANAPSCPVGDDDCPVFS